MSSSEPESTLRVTGGSPTLEIELLDSNFKLVAAGVAELEAAIDPGLYEIRFREGSAHESRLIKAEAGANHVEAPHFEPASPAPVEQTSTTHEYHQEPVLVATAEIGAECARPGPETGGLVIMVRNVRGQDELPFPSDVPRRLAVHDRNLAAADGEGDAWRIDPQAGWAVWSRAVVHGGYALRITDEPGGRSVFQSLWVDEGWQTMVFVPNTPDGPAPELATVHIVRVGEWVPWAEGSTIAVALESVLDGLRSGRSVVPNRLAGLLDAKFVNPFLGIAAAHALLLEPASCRTWQTVCSLPGSTLDDPKRSHAPASPLSPCRLPRRARRQSGYRARASGRARTPRSDRLTRGGGEADRRRTGRRPRDLGNGRLCGSALWRVAGARA